MNSEIDTIIQFSGLKPGRYTYQYPIGDSFFKGFENEELREGSVNFEVVLERRERELLFNFAFHGTVKTTCDRCLGAMTVPVEGNEVLCVKFSDTETSDNEDVLILPENAYQIDLAQWLYEYIAVRLPMQKVHEEGECDPEMLKYISEGHDGEDGEASGDESGCRTLGEGESDPRWAALKELLEK